jgi:hypothetical protein
MIDKEAIKEMKKIEKILKKLSKENYDVSIIEGNNLILTTQNLAEEREIRLNNIDFESKEGGLNADEIIYSIEI